MRNIKPRCPKRTYWGFPKLLQKCEIIRLTTCKMDSACIRNINITRPRAWWFFARNNSRLAYRTRSANATSYNETSQACYKLSHLSSWKSGGANAPPTPPCAPAMIHRKRYGLYGFGRTTVFGWETEIMRKRKFDRRGYLNKFCGEVNYTTLAIHVDGERGTINFPAELIQILH